MAAEIQEKKRTLDSLVDSMGKDIVAFMHDENIGEIALNTDQKLWIDTFDKGWVDTGIIISPPQAKRIIYDVAALSGTVIDIKNKPFLEAEIKESHVFGKARFQGELPAIVDNPSFNIRKHASKIFTLDDYVNQGTMTKEQKEAIVYAVHKNLNIIAAGGTSSGKTTLLNAILAEVSRTGDRIVIIEDTGELQCHAPNHVNLKTQRPSIDMDTLLRITLRKSPRRIVVGEVRGKEALSLLKAWNTGHDGGCATVHSDSAEETLYRLEQMISEVSVNPQPAMIGRAVDLVVYIKKEGVKRKIEEIIRVSGYDSKEQKYNITLIA